MDLLRSGTGRGICGRTEAPPPLFPPSCKDRIFKSYRRGYIPYSV
ncbi:unnamed protein product [Spirodela intermedia]|uniref:Uncharacterized protein n=1 Tax=Spirodela intermedia TaxID=51605 RepID=A0A7I8L634_SPIIN|nr:unnamed protein product [Spirodela intermedia]